MSTGDQPPGESPPSDEPEHQEETASASTGERRSLAVTVVAVAAILLAIGAPSYLAWANHQVGQEWQAEAARLSAEKAQLEDDLETVSEALERSEEDVEELEGRLEELAEEKAFVEDQREQFAALSDRIADVAGGYAEAISWFQQCRDEQSVLVQMALNFDSYFYSGQTYLISNQINSVTQTCGTAESYVIALESYIEELARFYSGF